MIGLRRAVEKGRDGRSQRLRGTTLIFSTLIVFGHMSIHAQNSNWVDSTLASMTLEEKVGQVFVADLVAVYSHKESPNFKLAQNFIEKYHVGGFVLAGGEITDIALMTNALQRISRTPLLINADVEGGLWFNHPYVWARGRAPELPRFVQGGGTSLPSLMAIGATGDPHFAFEFGRITGMESRAVGICWTNTPVADVNSNPNNPIVNTRSFGEDPVKVAEMVAAYVRGMQELNVIASLKHFPGHGDTEEDTHMMLPTLPFDRARLDSVEFVPFKAGIAAGAKAVMTAHIALTYIDPVKRPATLSPVIITDILRGKLGFDGIVVTDGMTMQGVTDHFGPAEAAIGALEAGADAVLVPADFAQAYNGVVHAVKSGRISRERLDQSVRRILAAKEWVGLTRNRFVDVENISNVVGSPQSESIADSMFAAALTLLRNEGHLLPLSGISRVHVITVTDEPNLEVGKTLSAVLSTHVQSVQLSRLWNESCAETSDTIVEQARAADVIVLGTYLSVGAWKGELGFSGEIQKFFQRIAKVKRPVVAVAFGDPYVLGKLPTTDAVIATYTGLRKAEEAVGKALVGAADMNGRLPVTIPGKYKRGDGIHLLPSSSEK